MKKSIIKCINERRKIRIIYSNVGRVIEPYYLFSFNNFKYISLYVTGYCHERNEIRTFKLSRITSRRQLKETWDYEPCSAIDLDLSKFANGRIVFLACPKENEGELSALGYNLNNRIVHKTYPREIQLSKMSKHGILRSPLEEKILYSLNHDKSIQSLEVEPVKIPYMYEGEEKHYVPDLLIGYMDGTQKLAEIKLSGEINAPKNQAKFKAAKEYATLKNMTFVVLGVDAASSNYHKTGTYGWNNHTTLLPIIELDPDVDYSQRNVQNYLESNLTKKTSNVDYSQKHVQSYLEYSHSKTTSNVGCLTLAVALLGILSLCIR